MKNLQELTAGVVRLLYDSLFKVQYRQVADPVDSVPSIGPKYLLDVFF